jgi:hypothetical protein
MAYKITPRNLEPTSALEKTLRSIVNTETTGVVGIGAGDDVAIAEAVTDKIGMYGVTEVVQADAIADATDAGTAISQLNLVIAALEGIGVIASS